MENTSVLTVGVTSDRALGNTFNTLRAQFERLRMPFEGVQVERYISEINRLASAVDTAAQAQRRLASDQTWAFKAQIERVRRLTDEIERQPALSLEQRKTVVPVGVSLAQRPTQNDPLAARSAEQGFVPLESANGGWLY